MLSHSSPARNYFLREWGLVFSGPRLGQGVAVHWRLCFSAPISPLRTAGRTFLPNISWAEPLVGDADREMAGNRRVFTGPLGIETLGCLPRLASRQRL